MATNTQVTVYTDIYQASGAQAGDALANAAFAAGQYSALQSMKRRLVTEIMDRLDFQIDQMKAKNLEATDRMTDVLQFFSRPSIRHRLVMMIVFYVGGPFYIILPYIFMLLLVVFSCVTFGMPLWYKPTYEFPPMDGMATILTLSHTPLYLIFSTLALEPRYVKFYQKAWETKRKLAAKGGVKLVCVKREALVKGINDDGPIETVELDENTIKTNKVCMVLADWTKESMRIVAKNLVQNRHNKRFTHFVFPQTREEYRQYHYVIAKWKDLCTVRFVRTPEGQSIPFTENIIGNFFTGGVSFYDTKPADIESIPSDLIFQMLELYVVGKYSSVKTPTQDVLGVDPSGALLIDVLMRQPLTGDA